MSHISDNELILFHYRDGLPSERFREIERALGTSPELNARYRALRRLLAHADRDAPPPQPDVHFESRLWAGLQPRLDGGAAPSVAAAPAMASTRRRTARPRRRLRLLSGVVAAAAMLVLMLNFHLARDPAPVQLQPPQSVAVQAPVAERVLVDQVATHLRSTEGVLLSVINNDGATLAPAGDAFVRSLADDNRLYAAAAAKRGDDNLAGFLRTLDPVLIELANHRRTGDIEQVQGLREFVRSSDLLFQVRAVEARLQSRGNDRVSTTDAMT